MTREEELLKHIQAQTDIVDMDTRKINDYQQRIAFYK